MTSEVDDSKLTNAMEEIGEIPDIVLDYHKDPQIFIDSIYECLVKEYGEIKEMHFEANYEKFNIDRQDVYSFTFTYNCKNINQICNNTYQKHLLNNTEI